jgi:hypothetical protein
LPAFQPEPAEPGSFSLNLILQRMLCYWWLVGLLTVAGGLVGLLALIARPPVYEAAAKFSASIDFVSTGPMTQLDEDVALNAIGDVLSSSAVRQSVVDRAAAEGINISPAQLKASALLERRVNAWDLRVRSPDPRVADRLANLWAEQGQAALSEAYRHALLADHWNNYLLSLERCLTASVASEPSGVQCSRSRFSEIQSDLTQAGQALDQERQASQGLFSGLRLGQVDYTGGATNLVLYGRSQGALAGCAIGFLLSIWLVQSGILARWLRRS